MLIYLAMIDNDEDKSKFEQIYITYKQTMFYVAHKILKDEFLAEDAVHRAFVKIIQNLDKIGEIECPKTKGFVVIIVERCAIDLYRSRKKENLVDINEFETFVIKEVVPIDEEVISQLDSPLTRAILALPEHYATIILLKYSHHYADKEIVKLLDLSEENVRKRLQRAKKKLATLLEEEC